MKFKPGDIIWDTVTRKRWKVTACNEQRFWVHAENPKEWPKRKILSKIQVEVGFEFPPEPNALLKDIL
ncbi:MAG TPA: hypothetical protein VK590_03180 [Saprospiraceae bacterium]|nr:hypothetical protein [Saprospiraceae bacterium]